MRSNHARARPAASHSPSLEATCQLEVKFKKEPRSPNFAYVNKVDNQSTPFNTTTNSINNKEVGSTLADVSQSTLAHEAC